MIKPKIHETQPWTPLRSQHPELGREILALMTFFRAGHKVWVPQESTRGTTEIQGLPPKSLHSAQSHFCTSLTGSPGTPWIHPRSKCFFSEEKGLIEGLWPREIALWDWPCKINIFLLRAARQSRVPAVCVGLGMCLGTVGIFREHREPQIPNLGCAAQHSQDNEGCLC